MKACFSHMHDAWVLQPDRDDVPLHIGGCVRFGDNIEVRTQQYAFVTTLSFLPYLRQQRHKTPCVR